MNLVQSKHFRGMCKYGYFTVEELAHPVYGVLLFLSFRFPSSTVSGEAGLKSRADCIVFFPGSYLYVGLRCPLKLRITCM